jgi:Immunoglobulin domain/Peptidase_C39 like family/WD40-like Beta Propeller Repeat
MNSTRALTLFVGTLLLPAASAFGGSSGRLPVSATSVPQAAFPVEVPAPIDVSADGELMLLFLPGGQGFELVNTRTGARNVVSAIPNTGYFASISPDKRYVCFKAFLPTDGRLLQVPVLYDIAGKKQWPLTDPAPAVGNPVASSREQIAYTLGERLIVLNRDLKQAFEAELGVVANVLAFSPDGRRLAFSDPEEVISWVDLNTGKRGGPPADGLRGYQPRFSPDGQGLLARRSNGQITGWRGGVSRNFGPASSAAWLDDDAVALVRQEVEQFAVSQTRVERRQFSNGSASPLLTRKGDAAIIINASVIALNAEDGVSLADCRTGLSHKLALAAQPLATAASASNAQPSPAPQALTPQVVTTNGTTVKLSPVPYVHQVYDTPDSFGGGYSCCNATATLMAILYYNRLPPHPITCSARSSSHTSNYGYYVPGIYSYNGTVFDVVSSAAWGSDLAGYYGGFGYFLQDNKYMNGGDRAVRLGEWVAFHGLTSGTFNLIQDTNYALQYINMARAEIDANHPVVMLNSITTAGHYITCIGYVKNQFTLIFNDPYGNKNSGSYPSANGAGAYYDWPGYNNGYQNLNSVWTYIYARGTVAANTNWGSYWDRNAATAGAGTAPGGTWDSVSTNWSSSANGTVATGPWYEQNAIFSAGTDATSSYTVNISGTQVVGGLFVQAGTPTFTGGQLYFLGTGVYFTNYVAAGATAIFNTPFVGGGSPDKWGAGTAVYSGASTCAGYFTHNEGTLAFGNNSALASVRLEVGDQTGAKVVTLKSADSNGHTLANYLSWKAATCNIGPGGNLTFSGPINVNSNSLPARTICVSNSLTTFSGVLTNTCGITKTGPGTLVLSGSSANSYGSATANGYTTVGGGTLKLSKTAGVAAVANGSLIVNAGGILLLGAANQIGDAVPMTLGGGTFQSAGFSETLGTLKVTANSVIDLGAASSVLTFAASSGVSWTTSTTLSISNWNGSITGGGAERVLFGSNSAGLSSAQVGQIRFVNPPGFPAGSYAAAILGTGEVVPYTAVPIITLQPQDKTGVIGSTITFTSTATGTPAPAFQWRLNGGTLSGGTNATLSLTNVSLGQAGAYSLVATNLAGTATSRSAQLSVYASAAPTLCGMACPGRGGQFQFSVSGVPGWQYAILASTDLTNWVSLKTNSSPFTFTDSGAGSFPSRFYRAQYLP